MRKVGWLVNDLLTAIPGVKTIWHDLLKWIPGLVDMTGVPFDHLAGHIETCADKNKPDYIIRNATYFRPLNLGIRTLAYLHDIQLEDPLKSWQLETLRRADIVVYGSRYAAGHYITRGHVIPIGTDFKLFKQGPYTPSGPVLWIGSKSPVKGYSKFEDVVKKTKYKFEVTLKKGTMDYPRVHTHALMPQKKLVKLMHKCSLLLCTSVRETQHLAGIEAAATGLPLVVPEVGCYHSLEGNKFGTKVTDGNFIEALHRCDRDINPREYFLDNGYDRQSCKKAWISLVKEL